MSIQSDLPARIAPPSSAVRALSLLIVVWAVLLGCVFLTPRFMSVTDTGDFLTRYTVRVALLFYLFAVLFMFRLDLIGWCAANPIGKASRLCWTLGLIAYIIHLVMAMNYYHHWSHADAMDHVEQASGFGKGIFVSHLFTLLWTLDAAWWWLRPDTYAARSVWVGRVLHGFMAFMIFCGTIVYETGFIRWAGVLLFIVLGVELYRHLRTLQGGQT